MAREIQWPKGVDTVRKWSAWFKGKPYQQWAKGTQVLTENQLCRRVQADRQTCRFLPERESHQDGFLVAGQKAVFVVFHD